MHRSKTLGGIALASLMLVALTGCPSIIANIVGATESVQQAINSASAGDTIKILGSHTENVTIAKDGITLTSETGGSIDGDVTVDGNNVTISNLTITGKLDTVPGSFNNLTLDNVAVQGWNNATINGTFTCDKIIQPGNSVQTAIDNSTAGQSICIASDTYAENIAIDKSLTLAGMGNPTLNSSANQVIDVEADEVTISGFVLTNPDHGYGIIAHDHSDVTITDNTLKNIGSNTSFKDKAKGIYVKANGTPISDIVIINNDFDQIGSLDGNGSNAVFVGDSTGTSTISNVEIKNNKMTNLFARTTPWGGGSSLTGGHGAYGILVNHGSSGGGSVTGLIISGNTIDNAEGLWSRGIGLEGPTPNAIVKGNDISNIIDHKSPSDGVGVHFEQNPNADTVTVEKNNFTGIIGWGVAQHAALLASHDLTVDARNNYWGAADGPSGGSGPQENTSATGSGVSVSKDVLFNPYANSPF